MNDFLQDLWHDLREKRLWPVALGLLLGVIAVPVVLAKTASEPAPQKPVAVEAPTKTDDLDLDVVDKSGGASAGSALGAFASKDPFKPPAAVTKAPSGDAKASSGASKDGGGEPPVSGDESPGGDKDPVAPPPPTTTQYEYVADVTFWTGNRRRAVKGLSKLDMLPSETVPLLIFMGVSGNGSNAVFLVDSTLRAAGEGRCTPSRSNCAFVRIGPGSEHTFTDQEGQSYTLRIDEIRTAKTSASSSSKRKDEPKMANASLGDQSESRRFSMPFLSDLIEVVGSDEAPSLEETIDTTPSDNPAESR
jgi:hypothetical protein